MDDKKKWDELKKSNQTIFSEIFLTYYDDLFRYAKRWVRDDESIKDFIQDLFFNLWNKREKLGGTNNIKAYLYSTCRNRLINFKEQSNKNPLQLLNETDWFNYSAIDFQEDEPINTEKIAQLTDCLNQLPPMQREAIYLKYFEGFDIDDIALAMNQKNQSVRNNLHRALTKLREQMLLTCFLNLL
jgi:RNA polymerase sigma factor (sigma-70 family)